MTAKHSGTPLSRAASRLMSTRAEQKAAHEEILRHRRRTGAMYISALGIFMVGFSYAGVPLYRMFCAVSLIVHSPLRPFFSVFYNVVRARSGI